MLKHSLWCVWTCHASLLQVNLHDAKGNPPLSNEHLFLSLLVELTGKSFRQKNEITCSLTFLLLQTFFWKYVVY